MEKAIVLRFFGTFAPRFSMPWNVVFLERSYGKSGASSRIGTAWEPDYSNRSSASGRRDAALRPKQYEALLVSLPCKP